MCRADLTTVRNLVGFWFLGLCNNFAYVIMLSAAHDILREERGNNTRPENSTKIHNGTQPDDQYLQCNKISTAAILLADVLPGLCVKLLTPVYIDLIGYRVKVLLVIGFASASYLIVGLIDSVTFSLLGVVCASISGGLGEPVFLGLSSHFPRDVISAWSSGTGGAGLFGALAYAGLTELGVAPRTTVLIMLVVSAMMAVSYFLVLKRPTPREPEEVIDDDAALLLHTEERRKKKYTPRQKLLLIKPLLRYMVPLAVVYFAEYFINQGLLEMLYFNNISWLNSENQYRWYQVDYQLGVFISRSSVNIIHIRKLWIMPVLQVINLVLLFCQVFLRFIPNFWIIIAIVFYEGLLGGATYVNTFYRIYKDVDEDKREYSLSVTSVADTLGICFSGAVSIPVHNAICDLRIKM